MPARKNRTLKKFIGFLFLCICFNILYQHNDVSAQFRSPEISLETYGIVSSSGTTPFWLQSNRHGMFASNGS